MTRSTERQFPTGAGIFFGLGLGGFFDGIVLHQILQWHHMVTSAGYPADSVENLQLNVFFDGLFHAATYIFVLLGSSCCGAPRTAVISGGQVGFWSAACSLVSGCSIWWRVW